MDHWTRLTVTYYLHCTWLGDGDGAGGIRTDDNDCNPPVVFAIQHVCY